MAELVRIERATRRFPPSLLALRSVSMKIRAGEFLAVTGPSGSGKTTLLNVLGLLDRLSEGDYYLNGTNVAGFKEREVTNWRRTNIGFVFQAFHLVRHLTVRENVVLGLKYASPGQRVDGAVADSALDAVGMGQRRGHFPAALSGGEQQRVAIARAVARRPKLLLCDEPTGNLDSANSAVVLNLLERTQTEDRALVVVTHNPAVASRAHRVVRIVDGQLSEAAVD